MKNSQRIFGLYVLNLQIKQNNMIETFGIRKDLEQAAGQPGERTPEDTKAIKHQTASLMFYLGDTLREGLKRGNYTIYDDPAVRENLLDLQVLIDESTLHFNNQKKQIYNESRKQIEQLEREKGNFIL